MSTGHYILIFRIIIRKTVLAGQIFRNLTQEGSLHFADLGNRIAPLHHLVDMGFEGESDILSSALAEAKIIRVKPCSGKTAHSSTKSLQPKFSPGDEEAKKPCYTSITQ